MVPHIYTEAFNVNEPCLFLHQLVSLEQNKGK